jgi:hypothetical protein
MKFFTVKADYSVSYVTFQGNNEMWSHKTGDC